MLSLGLFRLYQTIGDIRLTKHYCTNDGMSGQWTIEQSTSLYMVFGTNDASRNECQGEHNKQLTQTQDKQSEIKHAMIQLFGESTSRENSCLVCRIAFAQSRALSPVARSGVGCLSLAACVSPTCVSPLWHSKREDNPTPQNGNTLA